MTSTTTKSNKLDQLIRQEALDAYVDRWLGEVSGATPLKPAAFGVLAVLCLCFLTAVLTFASYQGHATFEGWLYRNRPEPPGRSLEAVAVLRDAERPIGQSVPGWAIVNQSVASALRIGETLTLELDSEAGKRVLGQITAITPVASGQHRLEIEAPSEASTADPVHFRSTIALERRPIYHWMFRSLLGGSR